MDWRDVVIVELRSKLGQICYSISIILDIANFTSYSYIFPLIVSLCINGFMFAGTDYNMTVLYILVSLIRLCAPNVLIRYHGHQA